MFVRAPGGRRLRCERSQSLLLTRRDAIRRLLVTGSSFTRRTTSRRHRAHRHSDRRISTSDLHQITDAHCTRWFAALAIDVHQSARDRLSCLRSALEKTRTPKPLVESQSVAGHLGRRHATSLLRPSRMRIERLKSHSVQSNPSTNVKTNAQLVRSAFPACPVRNKRACRRLTIQLRLGPISVKEKKQRSR